MSQTDAAVTTDPSLILVPTKRLARRVLRQQAEHEVAAGRQAWLAPAVLTVAAWIKQLSDDLLLFGDDPRVRLSSEQALWVWQGVIADEVLVGSTRMAEQAAATWRSMHEYGLTPAEAWPAASLSIDSEAMQRWIKAYLKQLADNAWVDEWMLAATLPTHIADGRLTVPAQITLQGFDLPLTPLQCRCLKAAEQAGARVEGWPQDVAEISGSASDPSPVSGPVSWPVSWPIMVCQDEHDELIQAARWARQQLQQSPNAQVAVVVSDLRGRVAAVERALRQVFDPPSFALQPAAREPWHISMGLPLTQWPLVADALMVLSLQPERLDPVSLHHLLRSPFVRGYDREWEARARLRRKLTFETHDCHHRKVAGEANKAGAPRLADRLSDWAAIRSQHQAAARPAVWAQRFGQELDQLGFGHGRTLDQREYQVLARWHQLLESLADQDIVTGQPISRHSALQRLRHRAQSTIFREQERGAAVEVLGVEEALGSQFDALWVTGLDNRQWPMPAQRNPLLPGPVQAALPTSHHAGCLRLARQQLAALHRCAPLVVGSHVMADDQAPDRRLSGLVVATADLSRHTEVPQAAAITEWLNDDDQGPPVPSAALAQTRRGGTSLLQQQLDCPFKAFAIQRLRAVDRPLPSASLDALQRGTLAHTVLETFWAKHQTQATVAAMGEAEREQAMMQAIDETLTQHLSWADAQTVAIERRCQQRMLQRWLEIELARPAFSVAAREAEVELNIGPLQLKGQVDRIDQLDSGQTLIIDYKTGRASRNDWQPGSALASVQLPAYAVNLDPPPAALAYACLKPDEMAFSGLSDGSVTLAGVDALAESKKFNEIEDWAALTQAWRAQLDQLAEDFAGGWAAVAPRKPEVCQYCHLKSLCRIHERQAMMDEDGDDE